MRPLEVQGQGVSVHFMVTRDVCSHLPSCSTQLLAGSRTYVFCRIVVLLAFLFSSNVSNKLPDPFQQKSLKFLKSILQLTFSQLPK